MHVNVVLNNILLLEAKYPDGVVYNTIIIEHKMMPVVSEINIAI